MPIFRRRSIRICTVEDRFPLVNDWIYLSAAMPFDSVDSER